jgi:hypothetical protein
MVDFHRQTFQILTGNPAVEFIGELHGLQAHIDRVDRPAADPAAPPAMVRVFAGTPRQYMAHLCRLVHDNPNQFQYLPLSADPAPSTGQQPEHDDPHRTAAAGNRTLVEPDLAMDLPTNGSFTAVMLTPKGKPSDEVRATLKGHGFFWNPGDTRGRPDWPKLAWLKHHVPAQDLATYRALAADLRCEFQYLARNPA